MKTIVQITLPNKPFEPVWSQILNTSVQCSNTEHWCSKKKHMFGQLSVFSVVWTMLLKIWFLNNTFWNHLGPIFEQQTMLSNGNTVNTFKFVGPTWCDKPSLSSLFSPVGPARKEGTLMRKERQQYIKWISSLIK